VITGFNTDVEHDGIVYHVQTEDKGLDTPLMLSLVYTGGAILASKRARYDDLIASGFDEKILAERLLRQHKLICAAIRAGRLEELKTMAARDSESNLPSPPEPISVEPIVQPTEKPLSPEPISVEPIVQPTEKPLSPEPISVEPIVQPTEKPPSPATKPVPTTSSPPSPISHEQRLPPGPHKLPTRVRPVAPLPAYLAGRRGTEETALEGMQLVLVDEKLYRGGDRVVLCVRVENAADRSQVVRGADVIVKILGSTFRPLIYQTKTGVDGMAAVDTELPHFRSGRAAILIRVTLGDNEVELRRIIQQG